MKQEKLTLTIAVVDDDESVLDAVKTVLDDEDWITQTYISGEAFLNDPDHHKSDCIILDAHLSGLSGVVVAESISKSEFYTPVIVLTAYPNSSQTKEIKKLGSYDVLVKPVTASLLIEKIQEAVSP